MATPESTTIIVDAPLTPVPSIVNVAELSDLRQAVRNLKGRLFDERCKLLRETKRCKELQAQIYQYATSCAQSAEENSRIIYHSQVSASQNIALSNELRTLLAVVRMPQQSNGCDCLQGSRSIKQHFHTSAESRVRSGFDLVALFRGEHQPQPSGHLGGAQASYDIRHATERGPGFGYRGR